MGEKGGVSQFGRHRLRSSHGALVDTAGAQELLAECIVFIEQLLCADDLSLSLQGSILTVQEVRARGSGLRSHSTCSGSLGHPVRV